MRRLLLAVLIALGTATTATTAHADPGLYSCGTSVNGSTGNGWCSGTGTFRVVVACDNGSSARSPWVTVQSGQGMVGTSCTGAKAVGARIATR